MAEIDPNPTQIWSSEKKSRALPPFSTVSPETPEEERRLLEECRNIMQAMPLRWTFPKDCHDATRIDQRIGTDPEVRRNLIDKHEEKCGAGFPALDLPGQEQSAARWVEQLLAEGALGKYICMHSSAAYEELVRALAHAPEIVVSPLVAGWQRGKQGIVSRARRMVSSDAAQHSEALDQYIHEVLEDACWKNPAVLPCIRDASESLCSEIIEELHECPFFVGDFARFHVVLPQDLAEKVIDNHPRNAPFQKLGIVPDHRMQDVVELLLARPKFGKDSRVRIIPTGSNTPQLAAFPSETEARMSI